MPYPLQITASLVSLTIDANHRKSPCEPGLPRSQGLRSNRPAVQAPGSSRRITPLLARAALQELGKVPHREQMGVDQLKGTTAGQFRQGVAW